MKMVIAAAVFGMLLGAFVVSRLQREAPVGVVSVRVDSTAYWAYTSAVDSLNHLKSVVERFESAARAVRWAPVGEIVPPRAAAANEAGRIIDSLTAALDSILGTEFQRDTAFVLGDSVATVAMSTRFRLWPAPAFKDSLVWGLNKILIKEVRTETIVAPKQKRFHFGVGVGYGVRGGVDVHAGIYYNLWSF